MRIYHLTSVLAQDTARWWLFSGFLAVESIGSTPPGELLRAQDLESWERHSSACCESYFLLH